MIWYIFWACVLVLILCGLGRQVEVERMNEDRRRRRLVMRHIAYEDVERISYLGDILFGKQPIGAIVMADVWRFRDYCEVRLGKRIPLS